MQFEIDQSIKIEQTNRDTAFALSNGRICTAAIPSAIKRMLQEEFRKRGKPRLFVYRTFIAGVVLLMHSARVAARDSVIIDREYFGKEQLLHSMFVEMYATLSRDVPEVHFGLIGKKSRAHAAAYQVTKGLRIPDNTFSFTDLKNLAMRN